MEEKIISTKICVYSYNELSEADKILVENAKKASENAYAPYSKFHVGAAVRLSDGAIVAGANQENAAFPSGTCAERTAVYYAHATHPDATIEAIAIAASKDGKFQRKAVAPCGACRQALLEYEHIAGKPMRVVLYGADEVCVVEGIASLLPLCFAEF